jgi:hypothetical protein
MEIKFKNTNYLSNIFVNYIEQEKSFFSTKNEFTDKYYTLNIGLGKHADELDIQAEIFSDYMDSRSLQILRRLIDNRRNFKELMYEVFIYSFFKSLFLGLFVNQVNANSNFGKCFYGHGYMFHVISHERNAENSNLSGYNIGFKVVCEEKLFLINYYKARFPFLNGLDKIDTFGCSFPFSEIYERILNELYYMSIDDGNQNTNNEKRKERKNDPSVTQVSVMNANIYKGNDKPDVRSYDDSCYNNVLEFSNNSLFNMFYSNDFDGMYYTKHSKESILLNRNYFLPRALLFSGEYSFDGEISFLDNLYHFIRFNESDNMNIEHLHLFIGDVFAITGIVPKIVPSSFKNKGKLPVVITDDIKKTLNYYLNDKGKEFALKAAEFIGNKAEEYVNDLIDGQKEDSSEKIKY